ncbi:MAG TPA: VOC family protein [Candidatus Binatia bacterium]|nr:VOC family protein [Candidatus Binatia bacterium]
MQRITTHLWYDKEAKEAAAFYAAALGNGSRVTSVTSISGTPSGDVDIVHFELLGRKFQAISAGPYFKLNPAISFHVICKTKEETSALWAKLSEGGKVLMELASYPWSPMYGWCQDRYGLSWQVVLNEGDVPRKITPVAMFTLGANGRAEEAIRFWTSLFPGSAPGNLMKGPDGTLQYGSFTLMGDEFGAMDGGDKHAFGFNEAVSFMVPCETQDEIDELWAKMSADPKAEQCGWLKDKFGLSWQIVPAALDALMTSGDAAQRQRVTQAFLKMKKFDIAELERAAKG